MPNVKECHEGVVKMSFQVNLNEGGACWASPVAVRCAGGSLFILVSAISSIVRDRSRPNSRTEQRTESE